MMKTVLVTGPTGLIGREFVRQYAADNWIVYATGVGVEALSDLAKECATGLRLCYLRLTGVSRCVSPV
jgi:NAD(P)-dependent dehydrogenase (short-subunit alcohol dehydrogenase family)